MSTEPQPTNSIETGVSASTEQVLYQRASFWRRVAGTLIDNVVIGAASAAIALGVLALLVPHVYTHSAWSVVLTTAVLLPSVLLFVYRWVANSTGGTLGKRIVGVRVVRAGSECDPGLPIGFIRTLMAMVSGLPIGLGYIWAAWDREGKTWHDKVAGTSVIRKGSNRFGRLLLMSGLVLAGLSTVAVLSFMQVRSQVSNFRMEGASMEPTFHNSELVTAVKHAHAGRGDVIVFRFPLDPSRYFIKRVIGVPGDTVEVSNETVSINGSPLKEDYIKDTPNYTYAPKTVPPGMYYVLAGC